MSCPKAALGEVTGPAAWAAGTASAAHSASAVAAPENARLNLINSSPRSVGRSARIVAHTVADAASVERDVVDLQPELPAGFAIGAEPKVDQIRAAPGRRRGAAAGDPD